MIFRKKLTKNKEKMQMTVAYHPLFVRQFKKLTPKLQENVLVKIELFKRDHRAATLRVHKLHGRLKNYWSFSVSHSQRIVFMEHKGEIVLIDIGDHEIYSKSTPKFHLDLRRR